MAASDCAEGQINREIATAATQDAGGTSDEDDEDDSAAVDIDAEDSDYEQYIGSAFSELRSNETSAGAEDAPIDEEMQGDAANVCSLGRLVNKRC